MADNADQLLEQALAMLGQVAAGGTAQAKAPIGVGDDYVPPRPGGSLTRRGGAFGMVGDLAQQVQLANRYFEGDEIRPANLPPEDRARLQRAMQKAGLIPKGTKYRMGVWDGPSQDAYRELLGYANQWGMDANSELNEVARLKDQYPEQLEPSEPLVLRPSNPEDVRSAVEAMAKRVYGKSRSRPDVVERLTQEWMRAEEETQRANYETDQQLSAGAMEGTAQTMPSLETFAENRLRAADPERAASFETLNQADVFFSMVDGAGG